MGYGYIKDFDTWNIQAKALNQRIFDDFFHEREIWWCALGVNIGSEQDGKNESFERPILIIKKISADLMLIAPLTSKVSNDKYRIETDSTGQSGQILLSQIRVISSRRLLRKICRVKLIVFRKAIVRLSLLLLNLLEIETPP